LLIPYVLGVVLAVVFYGLSVPYRRYVYPTLPESVAGLASGALGALALALVQAIKGAILTGSHLEQDDLVCMRICYRFSDVPTVVVLSFLLVRGSKSLRK
jgi:hypothetical protein